MKLSQGLFYEWKLTRKGNEQVTTDRRQTKLRENKFYYVHHVSTVYLKNVDLNILQKNWKII